MKNVKVLAAIVCVMAAVNFASADTIRGIEMDFVTVGNAGNTPDTAVMELDGTTGYGSVGYNYRIGKYEVSNAQWNTFTAAAGAPTGDDAAYNLSAHFTGAQQPTNNVSWYETAQFCNYLTSGDKSKGAYQFSGNNTNPGYFLGINRDAAISSYGTTYVIPTEDEWYKAAYHKNDGVTGNYWLYATQSNSEPSNDLINPDPGNNANFVQAGFTIGSPDYLTAIGEFENSDSAYGTFDQTGNIFEWNEARIDPMDDSPYCRGFRGGTFDSYGTGMASVARDSTQPITEWQKLGFRVASVPEPCSLVLLSLGGLVLRSRKK
jgi:formylglycine-generating enzyme required for sulfatase activity